MAYRDMLELYLFGMRMTALDTRGVFIPEADNSFALKTPERVLDIYLRIIMDRTLSVNPITPAETTPHEVIGMIERSIQYK